MFRSYKFRLYPTKQQIFVMQNTIETCRHLYNDSLGERSVDWNVGYWEQQNLLPLRKQDDKYLKQVHSQVLQDVLQRLDKAYQAFFKKIHRYPKFKRKEKYNSFTYPQYGGFRIKEGKLTLSYIGAIKFNMHRIPIGTLKTCTIIRDIDQWYCLIITDDGIDKLVAAYDKDKPVGIDVGLLNWITLSDGKKFRIHLTLKFVRRILNTCKETYQESRKVPRTEKRQESN